jgi:NADPH:quinone reductase-like Zn-dependent oxidoreductase
MRPPDVWILFVACVSDGTGTGLHRASLVRRHKRFRESEQATIRNRSPREGVTYGHPVRTPICETLPMRTIIGLVALVAGALTAMPTAALQPDPSTMKAVRIHDFGDASVLKYEDAPKPIPQTGEVLIRVQAAGVNPVDWKIRDGMMRGRLKLPAILGYDVSGVIEGFGEGLTAFKQGDEVFAYLSLTTGGGYAQYVCVPSSDVAKKPAKLDHKHAGVVPLAALTAWQAMFDTAKLQAGQTVLIHGAAGGVGHFAVQLAHAKGAKVIATASAENAEFVKGLGADQVIDYKKQKFEEIAKDVDVVFDMIGGDTLERSYGTLKEGGFLVSIVAPPDQAKLAARKAKGAVILVKPDGDQLKEIAKLIDEGKVKPDISAEFELKDIAKAHERSKSGGSGRGKIVLTVP